MLKKIIRIGLITLLLLSTISNIYLPIATAEDDARTVVINQADVPPKICGKAVRTVNGGFEKPVLKNSWGYLPPDEVPGWDMLPFKPMSDGDYQAYIPDELKKRYPDAKTGRLIEIHTNRLGISQAKEGSQYAELNATSGGVLYTVVPTPYPKKDIYISVYHKQRQRYPAEKMFIVSGTNKPEISTSKIGKSIIGKVINAFYESPQYTATSTWEERKIKISAEKLPDSGNIYLGFYTPNADDGIGNLLDDVHFGTPACLDTEKSAPKQVDVGDTFNYTITVKNVGGFPAKEISLKDVLPDKVVANGKPTAKITNKETGKNQTVALQFSNSNEMKYTGEIDLDDVIEFTIPVKAVQAGEAKNQASIKYKDTAADAYTDWEQTNTTSTLIKSIDADVSIRKSVTARDNAVKIYPGQVMDYTIEVKNHTANAEAMNVTIEDLLPEEIERAGDIKVTKQPATIAMMEQHSGNKVSYQIPKLIGNESVKIQIPVKVLPSAMQKTVSNTAKLTYQQPDNRTETKESKVDFKVLPLNPFIKLNKTVEKVGGGDTYNVGDRVKYTITAENTIPGSIANNVNMTVFDKLPEGITVDDSSVHISVPEGKYILDQNARQLVFHLGQLNGGETATMTFEGTLNEKALEKIVVNTVTAKVDLPNGGGEIEPDPSNPATVIIQPKEPKLVGEKSHIDVNGGEVKVGDTIQYTIRLKQEEAAASVKNVVIEDELPEYLKYKEGSGKVMKVVNGQQEATNIPVRLQENKLIAQIGDIQQVAEYYFTFEAEVLRPGAGKTFTNEAKVKGNKPVVEANGTVNLGDEVSLTLTDRAALIVKPYDEPTKPVDPENPKEPVDPVDPTTPDKKPIPGTKGPLSLDFASSLDFGEPVISSKKETYFAKVQQLVDGSKKMNYVQLTDNRADASAWTLSVRQNGQFTDEKGRELEGAKITFKNAEVLSSVEMPQLSVMQKEFDLTADGKGAVQNVVTGKSGTEEATYIYRFGNEETKESSIALEVPGETTKYVTEYKTKLTWSLSDVPSNE